MTIKVECSSCGGQYRIDASHAGKRIRCPACKDVISVPNIRKGSAQERPPQTNSQRLAAQPPGPRQAGKPKREPTLERKKPLPRQQPDPDRYEKSSGVPWKIMFGAAGGVIAVGTIGIVLFSMSQRQNVTEISAAGTESGENPSDLNTSGVPGNNSNVAATASNSNPEAQNGSTSGDARQPATLNTGNLPSENQPAAVGIDVANAPNNPDGIFASTSSVNAESADISSARPSESTTPTRVGSATGPTSVANNNDSSTLAVADTDLKIRDLFSQVKGSVVRVNVSSNEGAGNGSGFVIDARGIVVTNYHVIAGSNRAWVEFGNKERIDVQGLLFMDHEKDIAILKFDATRCQNPLMALPVAKLLPDTGTEVVAIGAPLGLDMSVTEGIVSATRSADELKSSIGLKNHAGTWVQTTAAISPGNSGGPLITKRGEVVAINTMSLVGEGAQALNFGISCNDIRDAMTELEEDPIPISPIVAPDMHASGEGDSDEDGIEDISGTPQGDKLLADLRKLVIVFGAATFDDPQRVVASAVKSEARQVLEKSGIEESLISSDKAALLTIMKLERSGNRLVLFITAHIIIQDNSSGRPHAYKVWERTGEVGSISQQAIYIGNLPVNLRKEIKDFFGKLKADILKARKGSSGTTN